MSDSVVVTVRMRKGRTQEDFQETLSYTMALRGLLGEGSITVRRMKAFAAANEMGRGGVSVAVAAAFANSSVWEGFS